MSRTSDAERGTGSACTVHVVCQFFPHDNFFGEFADLQQGPPYDATACMWGPLCTSANAAGVPLRLLGVNKRDDERFMDERKAVQPRSAQRPGKYLCVWQGGACS